MNLLIQDDHPDTLGIHCLALIDTTMMYEEDDIVPDGSHYKDATLALYDRVELGCPTTAAHYHNRIIDVSNGIIPQMKKAVKVFPLPGRNPQAQGELPLFFSVLTCMVCICKLT